MNGNVSPAERVAQESANAANVAQASAAAQQAQSTSGGGIGAVLGSIATLIASYTLPAIGWRYIFAPFLSNSGWGGIPVFLATSVVGPLLVNQLVRRLKSNQEEEEQKRIKAAAVALVRGGFLSEHDKSEVTKLLNARERYLITSRAIASRLPKDANGNVIADKATAEALANLATQIDRLRRAALDIVGQQYDDKTLIEEIIEKTMQEATESQKNEIRRLANEEAAVQKRQQAEEAAAQQRRDVEELKKQEEILSVAAASKLPPYNASIESALQPLAHEIVRNKRLPRSPSSGGGGAARPAFAAPSATSFSKATAAAETSPLNGFKSYPKQTNASFAPTKSLASARLAARARSGAAPSAGFDFGQPGSKFAYASPARPTAPLFTGAGTSSFAKASASSLSQQPQRQGILRAPASAGGRIPVPSASAATRPAPFGTKSAPTYYQPGVTGARGGTPLRTPQARLGTPAKSGSQNAPARNLAGGRHTPGTAFKSSSMPAKKRVRYEDDET